MSSFSNFSIHAPTGAAQIAVVSPNQYSDAGRTIGYPSKYSVYVNKISEVDGTQRVVERRKVSELVGNRLYLWHRPLTNSGAVTSISIAGGGAPVIDTAATNAKSAYIVFSTLPTADFTVTYLAVPDCINAWNVNTLQDDVMEMQRTLGVTTLTGSPGLRNLAFATFDLPNDAGISGIAQRAVYLSHLARDIIIGSTDVAGLKTSLGDSHTIQIGRTGDELIFDTTGFHVVQTNSTALNTITLGTKTGDFITYKGQISGEGQVTIGGPSWTNIGDSTWASRGYSGFAYAGALTPTYYSGSMLRVYGDVAIAGNIKSVGTLTVVTSTGETSVVLGDWTVSRDLIVNGVSLLNGGTQTSTLNVSRELVVEGEIVLTNPSSTINGLNPAYAAESLPLLHKRRLKNSIIDAPLNERAISPKLTVTSPYYTINNSGLVGDVFSITGAVVTAPEGTGPHPGRIQISLDIPIVSGTFTGHVPWTGVGVSVPLSGTLSGLWSPGLMDPGFCEVAVVMPGSTSAKYPVYGYFIHEGDNISIKQMSVFVPVTQSELSYIQPGAKVLMYNPGSAPYDFISAQGGAFPTFQVSGVGTSKLELSFTDSCKSYYGPSANISLFDALEKSAAGTRVSNPTGIAYIFAQSPGYSFNSSVSFIARPVPFHLNNEVPLGEVVAYSGGGVWNILETTCYRPNGLYDSAWIPIVRKCLKGLNSGRFIPQASETGTYPPVNSPFVYYFQHNLGPIQDLHHMTTDLYLASSPISLNASQPVYALTGQYTGYNQTHTDLYSFYGLDSFGPLGRNGKINGAFLKQAITPTRTWIEKSDTLEEFELRPGRDANVFYMDSRIIGVEFYSGVFEQVQTGVQGNSYQENHYKYLRVVVRRDA